MRVVVVISSGLGECLAVPCVLVAGGDVVSGVVVITDCKMESIGTGAVFFIGIVESVGARRVVIVVVPCIGIAGILVERLVCALIDSEVQGHGTIAAILIGCNECRCIS